MLNFYFNRGLILFLTGFLIAIISYFIFKKRSFGKFWGTLIIALVGSFIGAFIEPVFDIVYNYLYTIFDINIFPPVLISSAILWFFTKSDETR